ncbi:hypothetical protein GF319_09455 [Candidatus Bathyarchaeota archaeon]|jgi:hypothetical protein|nr:hypothetical protein [Candidatus Bathyarchaeota archaeon]
MKTFIKIYGPPILKSIKALEKISVDMPEVCIMDTPIQLTMGLSEYASPYGSGEAAFNTPYNVREYFGEEDIPEERCSSIISNSGESLGEYDFFFEWFKNPSMEEVTSLITKIDEALRPLGSFYTATTKK